MSKAVRCSDGTTYPTTLTNWHWDVLDLMIKHEWCGEHELADDAQDIYLKRRDEVDLNFQNLYLSIINANFEEWRRIEDGHINQNVPPDE